MLEWCSIAEIRTSSPARTFAPPVRLRDEVDPLGRPAHEDDLARVAGVDEVAALVSRAPLVGLGARFAQRWWTPRWMFA